jgi:hypothetical protein
MILPQTDHAMILLLQLRSLTHAFVTGHDVTIAPLATSSRSPGATSCIAAMTRFIGWSRAKSPRDQRNHSQVRNVGLALSYTNSGGRL